MYCILVCQPITTTRRVVQHCFPRVDLIILPLNLMLPHYPSRKQEFHLLNFFVEIHLLHWSLIRYKQNTYDCSIIVENRKRIRFKLRLEWFGFGIITRIKYVFYLWVSVLIGIQKKSYETLLINYLELCSTTRNIHLLHCEHKIGKYEENETSLVSWKKGLEPRKLKLCEVATTHKLLSKPFSI